MGEGKRLHKKPNSWRQNKVKPAVISKRHKTVRNFLTNFENIFPILAKKYLTPFPPFIYRHGTRGCHQIESTFPLKKYLEIFHPTKPTPELLPAPVAHSTRNDSRARHVRDDLQMTTGRYPPPALLNFDSHFGHPERPVQAGETRPLLIVLVVDFKGFIQLKKQAQQHAK
ncbi:hypothetical protein P0Y43_08025 [Pseudomonas entomophila]|uniref:hypothetical protein n=1 Tax=Pseudomonas entomophila TaxID=312306 RepID=UPI0023D80177|nr:hypothetical protein [Pseudomonas entomophila]MDF0730677.1 hypothetical protein [Pseudomonas entomophila]